MSGIGDLLALFRCISCRYTFSLNWGDADLMGAPGRVVMTGEASSVLRCWSFRQWPVLTRLPLLQPEMCNNVQKHSKEVYLRTTEAAQCRVQSTIIIPVFEDAGRNTVVGALEVVQTAEDMPFPFVLKTFADILPVRCLSAGAAFAE